MTLSGLEHPAKASKKLRFEGQGGAKTGAPAPKPLPLDPDLAHLVAAWATLPEHIRSAIRALLGTVAGPS